jgi:hypothetical protein
MPSAATEQASIDTLTPEHAQPHGTVLSGAPNSHKRGRYVGLRTVAACSAGVTFAGDADKSKVRFPSPPSPGQHGIHEQHVVRTASRRPS